MITLACMLMCVESLDPYQNSMTTWAVVKIASDGDKGVNSTLRRTAFWNPNGCLTAYDSTMILTQSSGRFQRMCYIDLDVRGIGDHGLLVIVNGGCV